MHSKMVIWDLFTKLTNGQYAFGAHHQIISFEPIYGDLIKRYIKFKGHYRTVFAADLSLDWFENNVFGLTLFGNENYIILESEKLLPSIIERLKNAIHQVDTSLILIGKKQVDLGKAFNTTEIIAPNFWQMDKLLDFFLKFNKVQTTLAARQFILDSIEPSPAAFYQTALTLQNFYAGQIIDVAELKLVLEKNKLDKFEFATLLSQKRLGEFFSRLSSIKTDNKTLRNFFLFMQTHLFKIFDPSYAKKKSKLSNYDKEIVAASKSWLPEEIDKVMDELRILEQVSKVDADKLESLIQHQVLQYHGPSFHK